MKLAIVSSITEIHIYSTTDVLVDALDKLEQNDIIGIILTDYYIMTS
jgi:hypothetical protein